MSCSKSSVCSMKENEIAKFGHNGDMRKGSVYGTKENDMAKSELFFMLAPL